MLEHFQGIGLTFREATIDLRERIAFSEEDARKFLFTLKEVLGLDEALVISTCNRTEIYFSHQEPIQGEVIKLLASDRGMASDDLQDILYAYDRPIERLFRVALGLDSQVLGDLQIINQVKRSYQWTADEQLAGPMLHRLMHTIFYANKRVVQETKFRDGTASTASVSVSLIDQVIKQVEHPKVLLIGLGEIGLNILENLNETYSDVTLMNRTLDKAEKQASMHGYRAVSMDKLTEEIERADVILSAVQVKEPVIGLDEVSDSISPKLFIDLSVPRSISSEIESRNGVILYTTDDLVEISAKALKRRQVALPDVEAIMNESLQDFRSWSVEMEVSPTIKLFKERLEEIRKEEISRALKNCSPETSELLDDVTKRMIQKVIKLPVLQLKAACKRGDAENLVDVLHDLFNLEERKQESSS